MACSRVNFTFTFISVSDLRLRENKVISCIIKKSVGGTDLPSYDAV